MESRYDQPMLMKKVMVLFSCKHWRMFPRTGRPHKGHDVWCPECEAEVKCLGVPTQWLVRCVTCRLSVECAQAPESARMIARKHSAAERHKTLVFNANGTIVHVYTNGFRMNAESSYH